MVTVCVTCVIKHTLFISSTGASIPPRTTTSAPSLPFPSPSSPSVLSPSLCPSTFLFFLPPPLPPLLRSRSPPFIAAKRPTNPAMGLEERCELPQWVSGESPSLPFLFPSSHLSSISPSLCPSTFLLLPPLLSLPPLLFRSRSHPFLAAKQPPNPARESEGAL